MEYDRENTILLDVRTEKEYIGGGHLEGALNIPVDRLRARLGELDITKEILLYCQIGLRGYVASRILTQNGYNVINLTGGYKSCLISPLNLSCVAPVETPEKQIVNPNTQVVK